MYCSRTDRPLIMHRIRQCQIMIFILKHIKTVEHLTTDIYIPITTVISGLNIIDKSRSHPLSQFLAVPREKKKISMTT